MEEEEEEVVVVVVVVVEEDEPEGESKCKRSKSPGGVRPNISSNVE